MTLLQTGRGARPTAFVVAALALSPTLAGCSSGNGNPSDKRAVRAVVVRWLAAERAADGGTWCSLLDARRRRDADAEARTMGPHVTCAEFHGPRRLPGISSQEQGLVREARLEVTAGARVEGVTVDRDRATATFSWLVPTRPNPIVSNAGVTRRGDRYLTKAHLRRERGAWKID